MEVTNGGRIEDINERHQHEV
jgi:hypothetical protein